jgi:hypothetical protein
MALALNNYETIVGVVTTNVENVGIYTSPVGYDSIVLLAQAANISDSNTNTITLSLRTIKNNTTTEVIKNYPIPPNDSVSLVTGKLVLEVGDSLIVQSGNDNEEVKFISSVLETLNQ